MKIPKAKHNEENIRRLFLLDRMPKNGICCEIGVWRGEFSEYILRETKPKELHLIDPWEYYEDYSRKKGNKDGQEGMEYSYDITLYRFKDKPEVQIHRGPSSEVLPFFDNEYFDWVYIDGNHDYDYVKKDLELAYDKVKVGGYITGDDYWSDGKYKQPLKQAVDEFIDKYNVEILHLGTNHQYILRKL
jgi:hypothetical protein